MGSSPTIGSMGNVKKGLLTASPEWAKHLRPWWKRQFWKGERKVGKNEIKRQLKDGD